MIDDEFTWNTLAFLRGRSVKKTFVHVLAVVDITTSCLVVVQIVLLEHTASFPVTHDEFLGDHGFHCLDVDSPLPEPLSTLNEERHAMLSIEHR